jgi:hypothetical protein
VRPALQVVERIRIWKTEWTRGGRGLQRRLDAHRANFRQIIFQRTNFRQIIDDDADDDADGPGGWVASGAPYQLSWSSGIISHSVAEFYGQIHFLLLVCPT